jgi:hypothetical protein
VRLVVVVRQAQHLDGNLLAVVHAAEEVAEGAGGYFLQKLQL